MYHLLGLSSEIELADQANRRFAICTGRVIEPLL
jgi:hypothetical protein